MLVSDKVCSEEVWAGHGHGLRVVWRTCVRAFIFAARTFNFVGAV